MRKEVILAIIIGVILGGVVLYGLKIANQSAVQSNTTNPENIITPTVAITAAPTPSESITIISPTDHSVFFTDTATISGKTTPLTNVAVTSESSDILTQSDNQGNYSAIVDLIGGENNINVVAAFPDGSTTSKTIMLIYTSSKIDN